MNAVIIMMYFANAANVNVGVVMAITAINAFLTAFMDWILFNIKLGVHLILGMVCIILGSICVSLNNY